MSTEPNDSRPAGARTGNGKRRKVMFGLLAALLLAGAGYGLYWFSTGRWVEATDDAYVQGDLVTLTPQVDGIVTSVDVADTQYVRRGQELVRLDDTDARVAVAQAEAQLAQTVRDVAQLFETVGRDRALIAARRADLRQAEQDLDRARVLAPRHGVSQEQLQHAEAAFRSAGANLTQAQRQLASARAAVAGTTPQNHPQVLLAEARLRQAWVGLARTRLQAPVAGVIAQKSVEVGQQVAPGAPLLAIVPLDQAYVDANFKETQLADLRIGQPVKLVSDLYGGGVVFHGKVLGFSAGTGSAFAVLPPQNASGNWIKIVQRLPVRISLDPKELAAHPLSLGLSMTVDVDTHDRGGPRLSQQPVWTARRSTQVYADQAAGVEPVIRKILRQNLPDDAPAIAGGD
ncbi:MAG: HlyD family efflux transporter periplasmic adaptor subunit [Gammaproteobacteria bacterium]|nr:HlyD family efflux transporter periplasmic adaptor subunit [Gammaproteobacteria bacterium]